MLKKAKKVKAYREDLKVKDALSEGKIYVPEEFKLEQDLTLTKDEQQKLNQLKWFDNFEWDYECGVLRSGSSFGELALLGNGLRLVTIKCQTTCYIAELDRKDF